MNLIRFGEKNYEKPGVIIAGARRDCSAHFEDWNNAFFSDNGLEKLSELIADKDIVLPEVPKDNRWGSCVARPNMPVMVE